MQTKRRPGCPLTIKNQVAVRMSSSTVATMSIWIKWVIGDKVAMIFTSLAIKWKNNLEGHGIVFKCTNPYQTAL